MATDRIAQFESRCSPTALDLLQYLQGHPCFPELVENLERTKGHISPADVKLAFLAITMGADQHA